jgi:hypothetical protein
MNTIITNERRGVVFNLFLIPFLRSTYSPQLRHIKYLFSLSMTYQASHQCKIVCGIIVLHVLIFKF